MVPNNRKAIAVVDMPSAEIKRMLLSCTLRQIWPKAHNLVLNASNLSKGRLRRWITSQTSEQFEPVL